MFYPENVEEFTMKIIKEKNSEYYWNKIL